jgi:CHAT domain-containing protein
MALLKVNSPGWDIRAAAVSRGAAEAGGDGLAGLRDDFLAEGAEVEEEVILQPRPTVRGAAAAAGPIELTAKVGPGETAVLAIRRLSGALTFHPPTETVRGTRGGPAELRFTVPPGAATSESTSRGLADKAVKAILVKVQQAAVDRIAEIAFPALAQALETTTWKRKSLKEGWLKVTPATLGAKALTAGKPASTERSLLFIHGTFANAASTFTSLAGSSFFTDVAALYDDRMFAFDHFTLSRTPEENARMLLEGLPDKAFTFDVITHSRGGLVLRNLVERAAVFGPLSRRFRAGHVVLVASPNDGTPLATPRRWEDTLGWVANLLELFPDNPFTTGPAFVANGLVWLARHLSGDLPGLSAMDGDGAMIRALQGPPGPPVDQYSALVANCNPAGDVLRRLLDVGLDQFFGSANDLVVPSEGGWRIDRSGSTFITGSRIGCFGPGGNLPGDSVTHVDIFAQPGTSQFLEKALAGDAQPLVPVDPAKSLPDRRLLRAGAAGVAAPLVTSGALPAAARRPRVTEPQARSAASAPGPATFAITVVNGDLSFERRPLLIGHYRSTRLTGAEAFIDRMIQNAMSRSLAVDVYPAEPGSHQVFLNTFINVDREWLTARPQAVIVVGLGQEGTLRPGDLAMSVRRAVVAWAQRIAEDVSAKGKDPEFAKDERLELASTLMASGGLGITAAQAAVLIAQGVFEANQLFTRPDSGLPSVSQLRLIELYTDRASEAWRALRMQADATPGHFTVVEPIEIGTGSLLRPIDSGYRGAAYDYIEATMRHGAGGESEIEYSLDTSRARTEVRAQATQARLVRNLVKEASSASGASDIGRTLYKLLVPIELEGFLASASETQIVLDEHTAGIPWEMLDDDNGGGTNPFPWAIRSKLLRKFKTETFRDRVTDANAQAAILVIGEPACPPDYPPLPGAYAEAAAVYECLAAAGGDLVASVRTVMAEQPSGRRPNARAVLGALLNGDWRVVHVAGHGASTDDKGGLGGVVLSDGTFLGPSEVAAMRMVPQLVFLNCCHLGAFPSKSVLSDRARFASGVARKLIEIGVRAVVVAGWAVDDTAAQVFAETFYRSLLNRERFIDAVTRAREAAFAYEGYTWAAYQCYGDPDWKLSADTGRVTQSSPSPDEFKQVATIAGLKLALRTLTVESTYQQQLHPSSHQRQRLEHLQQRWQAMKWTVGNRVGELFAEAFAAVGDLSAAIRWYDVVLASEVGDFSVRAFENRSNFRIRVAWEAVEAELRAQLDTSAGQRAKRAGRTRSGRKQTTGVSRGLPKAIDSARRVIEAETKQLLAMPTFGATAERDTLLGSAMKRLAMVEDAAGNHEAERRAVTEMKKHYQRALDRRRKAGRADVYYPAVNVIVAQLALRERVDRALFVEARAGLRATEVEGPNFWSVVGEAELRLFEAIAKKHLNRQKRGLIASYGDVSKRMRGSVQWRAVYDTANFVLSRYRRQSAGARAAAEARASDEILDYLRKQVAPSQ